MRPKYETKEDLANEQKVMDALVEPYAGYVYYQKLPIAYQIDFGVYRKPHNMMTSVVEVKTRNISIDTYDSLMLSAHKVHALHNWQRHGLCAIVAYNLNDGIYLLDINDVTIPDYPVSGGRYDREDWQDVEPVYHFATDLFRRVDNE